MIILPSHCFPYKIFLCASKLWSVKLRNIYIYICLTKFLPTVTSIWLDYVSFWLFRKCITTYFCVKKYRYLRNDYHDTLTTKNRKNRGDRILFIKVKFHELEWSSPLRGLVTNHEWLETIQNQAFFQALF